LKLADRLDRRPIIVVLAGPNGAGKTTFYHSHLKPAGLRFVNADVISRDLAVDAYDAARVVGALRSQFVSRRDSFVLETVFSDPVGDKVRLLRDAEESGYTVVVCFVGLSDARISGDRVAMRVSQGGHDVPWAKLKSRFPRTLRNLERAAAELGTIMVFDNSDLRQPFRKVAVSEDGRWTWRSKRIPDWCAGIVR
jgi:predicted ABC-type ATPase